jgi:hypothetical protein
MFFWAFVVAAGMASLGMVCWGVILGAVAPVDWRKGAPT